MKVHRRFAGLLCLALGGAGLATFFACSSDPVATPVDGGSDVTVSDATPDVAKDAPGIDATPDVVVDAGVFGTGTFGNEAYLPLALSDGGAATASYGIAAGDLNGDKHLDLVISGGATNSVLVYLGKGDGTFGAPTSFAAGAIPFFITIADLNADGKPDLAVANNGSANVSVLLGQGNGAFAAPVNYATSAGTNYVITPDLNGDGKLDLVATEQGGGKVDVFLNSGNGTFAAAVATTVPAPWNVAAVDLNGDQKLDLLVGTATTNVYVMLNNGTGTFGAAVPFASDPPDSGTVSGAYAALLGDFNGDNAREVAVAKCLNGQNQLTVLPFLGDASLGQATSATPFPNSVCLYDLTQGLLDPDGIPDLVMGGHSVYVRSSSLLDAGAEASIAAYTPDAGGGLVKTIAIADLNEDGVQDIAALVQGRPFAYLLFGQKKQ